MRIAIFLFLLLVGFAHANSKPNFVLIIADDVSLQDIGVFGSENAKTPNIDAIALRGMRFDKAILTASSCSPSRASIATGRYPHNNGAASELHRPIPPHIPWFPQILKDAGYYTALSGKSHIGGEPVKKGGKYFKAFDKIDNGRLNNPNPESGAGNWVRALRERPKDKPFFLWLASYDAHRDWDDNWRAEFGKKISPDEVKLPPALIDTPETREDFAAYCNEIRRLDYYVGEVVRELESQNALSNTVIIFLADNGRPFPRAKTRLIDDGMKTPLLMCGPGIEPKTSTKSLVSSIDIAPTILELAGLDKPKSFQGKSFAPILSNPNAKIREYAFSEHNWHDYQAYGRSVRKGEYLYIINKFPDKAWIGPGDSVSSPSHQQLRKAMLSGKELTPVQSDIFLCPRPGEELYDTSKADKLQIKNLANDPHYADVLNEMRKAIKEWTISTRDSVPLSPTPDAFDRDTGKRILEKNSYSDDYAGKSKNAEFLLFMQ